MPTVWLQRSSGFQKILVQILSPLIRDDKIIVYMDDILIASATIEQNLEILEEMLTILRKYGFQLNYVKCQFLRKRIEFLGYVVSTDDYHT